MRMEILDPRTIHGPVQLETMTLTLTRRLGIIPEPQGDNVDSQQATNVRGLVLSDDDAVADPFSRSTWP